MNRPSPPALGATEVHDVRSAAIDDDLRIFVASCGDDPTSTLVVADGNGLFGLATDVVRLMRIPNLVPAMLVVAIGYPDAPTLVDARRIRMRDLTPTRVSAVPHSGGAENFAGFLADELLPWVSGRFPGATGAVTYFGHSLGGLFGAHLVLTRPGLFHRHIVSSPSLWWDDDVIFRIEEQRAMSERDLETEAFFGIGSLETDAGRRAEAAALPDGHRFKPPAAHLDMVADMRRFTEQLGSRRYPSLQLEAVEIADEFHATVPGAVLGRALRRRTDPPARRAAT